jgi:hypothetical protein
MRDATLAAGRVTTAIFCATTVSSDERMVLMSTADITSADLLVDAFGRVREEVHAAVAGLTQEQLEVRLDPDANSIAWLIWHLSRVQDDHVAGAFGVAEAWPDWRERFAQYGYGGGDEVGYGHSAAQVALVRAPGDVLTGYYDAVYEQTIKLVSQVTPTDLARIVDEHWNPPVTLAVRVISVISDCLQHVGQATFVRGILLRS